MYGCLGSRNSVPTSVPGGGELVPRDVQAAGLWGSLSWMYLVAPVAVGGLWVAVYLWQLSRLPLAPRHPLSEPEMAAASQPHGAT